MDFSRPFVNDGRLRVTQNIGRPGIHPNIRMRREFAMHHLPLCWQNHMPAILRAMFLVCCANLCFSSRRLGRREVDSSDSLLPCWQSFVGLVDVCRSLCRMFRADGNTSRFFQAPHDQPDRARGNCETTIIER